MKNDTLFSSKPTNFQNLKLKEFKPAQSLNQAYRKEHVELKEFERFADALQKLLEETEKQGEENTKNLMADFLKDAYYKNIHAINTKGKIDAVIFHRTTQKSNVGVMMETKKPESKDFINKDNFNKKSFHQLIYYYLIERVEEKNTEIKNLIITDVYEWFVFDENEFDRLFYQNKELLKKFTSFQKEGKSTEHFYKEIAHSFVENSEEEINCTYFNLKNYQEDINKFRKNNYVIENERELDEELDTKKLIHLYKILSPVHLLKKPFANDSNSLNKDFYNELLHILGLEEVKQQNKKIIERKNKKEREAGSFLENTISNIEDRKLSEHEKIETTALKLSITWINRILFLKLLEAQLLNYHKKEKKEIRQKFRFLNSFTIKDFDALNKLFFKVLAVKREERTNEFDHLSAVPYLNSSLFEVTELENTTISVNSLSDTSMITLYSKTILKDANGNR